MNSTKFVRSTMLLPVSFLTLLGAHSAQAQVTINYTLSDYSFAAPSGDANFDLFASAATKTLILTLGVPQTVNVQGLLFEVDPTTKAGEFSGTVTRILTLNGLTHNAVQGFNLTVGAPNGITTHFASDSLSLLPGQVIDFDLGSQGVVEFTPETLASALTNRDSLAAGGLVYQGSAQGQFLLLPAAIPEASTTLSFGLLLALGGFGLLTARRRSAPLS